MRFGSSLCNYIGGTMVISNYKRVEFKVSPLLAIKLRQFATKKGTTMTDVITCALHEYLDKELKHEGR